MKESNFIYLYNGTWEDLLKLIFWLLKEKRKPLQIMEEIKYENNLLSSPFKPVIDPKILNFKKNVSKEVLKISYYVFLSSEKEKELIIYYFLLNSLKYQKEVIYMRNLRCVNKALAVSKRVSREAHKWKGFLRFKEMQNQFFYAEFNADNNILGILANHFTKRLPKENWVIKDEGRDILCIYDQTRLYFLEGKDIQLDLNLNTKEKNTEELWKSFFKTNAIKERENRKCQQNFMPKKYWQNILEMEGEK